MEGEVDDVSRAEFLLSDYIPTALISMITFLFRTDQKCFSIIIIGLYCLHLVIMCIFVCIIVCIFSYCIHCCAFYVQLTKTYSLYEA